jgi:hypothetical protein
MRIIPAVTGISRLSIVTKGSFLALYLVSPWISWDAHIKTFLDVSYSLMGF